MSNLYEADSYMVRQKVLKLLGAEFHIYSDDSMQQLIGYSKQKALKLKEYRVNLHQSSKCNRLWSGI